MNIYCNGDSYTAGQEILDYQFSDFPGYSPYGSHLAVFADHNWARIRVKKGTEFFGSHENLISKEKEFAWPGQLKKINPDINIINGGVSGSSITGISNRTVIDLIKNKNIKFDFIFIQLTGPLRIEFYNSTLSKRKFMREITMGWIDDLPTQSERDIAKGYLKYYKDSDFSIKYLYALINLKNAVKGITGIEPIFLMGMKIWKDQIINPLLENNILKIDTHVQLMLDNSGILDISEENIMETTQIKNNFLYTPVKHYELKCHKEYARIIYNKYLK